MQVLFAEGYVDRDYLTAYTDFPPDLEHHLAERDPAWAARITGLSEDEITAFARLYGATERSFIRLGYGFSRSRNGSANMHAATCLPALTGAWRHRGGGALYSNRDVYRIDDTLIKGLDARDPSVRMLDMSRIGPVLTGERADLGDGPPVTAMLIQNTNPAVVAPESRKVRDGLLREDLFVCVHEQFMTDTAKYADIVLPATTFLEHDDIYKGGGHMYLQVAKRVIEPLAEARPNHDVHCALARRLGARHRGFEMSVWEIIDETLRASGWPGADEMHGARWLDCMPDFETAHHLNGFPTSDGKFHFKPDWSAIGPAHAAMPALPDHMAVIEESDGEHPFRLVTAPAHGYLNTSFTETPTSRKSERRPSVYLHTDDAAALGLEEGDLARVGNRRASIRLHARLGNGMQPGIAVIESIWPNGAFVDGLGVNALVSAERGYPAGGAVYHDTAVWIRPG
jgi:anaerobic selenocysteine-containing dehydrogenase